MADTGIAKARLVPLTGTSSSPQSQDTPEVPASGGFEVAFNPATLRCTYSTNLESGKSRGGQHRQYIGTQSTELAVDLVFDTGDIDRATFQSTGWGDDEAKQQVQSSQGKHVDVRIFTARIVRMLGPTDKTEKKPSPFRVQFVWGSFLFEGVIKSLTETLELFSEDGVPVRASLTMTISEDTLEFRKAQTSNSSPSLATSQGGSSAAQVAQNSGLPPQAGKQLAAQNGLDDLRSVPSDQPLTLPALGTASLGISASASASLGVSASFGASASASFGASASLGVSASASADISGGFGGGSGIGVTLGAATGFGLDAGASGSAGVGLSAGIGVSAGAGASIGLSGGLGVSAGVGASIGLNLSVSGGVAGSVAGVTSAAVSLPGAGSVGGPSPGGAPGAQAVMDPNGRVALAPALPTPMLPPPSATPTSGVSTTRSTPPPLSAPPPNGIAPPSGGLAGPSSGTRVAGTIGLSAPAAPGGQPAPLPPQAAARPRGAFGGISGVPLKLVRFNISTPPVVPLAYRRLPPETQCLAQDGPCPTPTAVTMTSKRGGGCCGCTH